ncbi:MAG: zinc ribbon domain-containing protein [Lachnospiraceae bacterium]|nr:zinc ribbon domain-containing protein [Lachnospiraceae bacterium]
MSKCRNCNVEILDETEFCPLCHSVLEQTEELENMYPDARMKTQKMKFATRLYLFCALVVEFLLIVIDFHGENQVHWSVLVGLGLLYVYTVLRYAVLGKSGYRAKTIVLVLLAVLITVVVDFITGYRGWSVDYVASGGILLVDVIIIALMIWNRRNWQSYIMWQITMILFALIPAVLYLIGLERNFIMAFLPLIVSVFLFIGTLMIGGRRAGQELYRRFHI